MTECSVPFVRSNSAYCYQVRIAGRVFNAPVRSEHLVTRRPCEKPDGTHLLELTALWRASHHQDPDVWHMKLYAIFLESYEDEVVSIVPHQRDVYVCAVTMMAWHLVDTDASLPHLYQTRVDFMGVEHAVWAVIAFLRDMWALEQFLSWNTFMSYFRCCQHLIRVLRSHDVATLLVM